MGEVVPFGKRPFVGKKVKLGELISKAAVKRCGEESYPVLSMTMHDGIIEQRDRFKKAIASKDTSAYKVVNPGQLVVGFPIDEGVIYVQNYEFPGIMSPAYNVWDIDNGKVNPSYLELALHSPNSMAYYTDKMRGTTARRRSITADNLCALEIPLPSLDEQAETLAVFEEVKSAQSACSAYVDKLDQLVKSRFVEMFGDPAENPMGWETKSLTDIGECKNGLNYRSEDSGHEIRCLGVSDFKDRAIIKDTSILSSVSLSEKPGEGYLLKDGDIVFVRSNGNKRLVGRCLAVYPGEEAVVFSGFCIRLRVVSESVRIPFLIWALKQPSMRQQIFGRGANVQNLNQKILGKLQVPIPPLAEQDKFLSFVAQVDKSRFVVQQQIDKLQTLYDSLAQEYFGD